MTQSQFIQLLKRQPRLGFPSFWDGDLFETKVDNFIKSLNIAESTLRKSGLINYNQKLASSIEAIGKQASFFENRILFFSE